MMLFSSREASRALVRPALRAEKQVREISQDTERSAKYYCDLSSVSPASAVKNTTLWFKF